MTLTDFLKYASWGQKLVLQAKERFLVVVTGLQAGKTTLGAVWLCKGIYEDFQAGITGDYLIAAPTISILRQSTLPKFKELIPPDWGEWKEGAKCFQLKWGSRIFVRSTDEPDHLEGMTIRRSWLDEAGQMKQGVWINVQGRLSIAQGPCLMTTTPYSMGWFYRDVVKKGHRLNEGQNPLAGPQTDPNIAVFNWKSTDNPAFAKDEYDRMKATLAPAVFERRYEGKFTQLEGLVYPDSQKNIVDPFVLPPEWIRFAGMDFGHTNPTAIVCVAEDPTDKIYYAYKLFYKAETILAQSAAFIQDNGLREVLADPQSKQLIEELRRAYHIPNVAQADNSIELGIERVTALFRTGRLKIFSSCKELIEELESYHRALPDNDGFVRELPVAKNNHACDALRYAFSKQRGLPKRVGFDPLDTMNSRRGRVHGMVMRHELQPNSWTGY